MSSLSLAQLQQTVARYLMALIFCGARSASALALAAALIAGLGDCWLAGSAICFSAGNRSRWGLSPL